MSYTTIPKQKCFNKPTQLSTVVEFLLSVAAAPFAIVIVVLLQQLVDSDIHVFIASFLMPPSARPARVQFDEAQFYDLSEKSKAGWGRRRRCVRRGGDSRAQRQGFDSQCLSKIST